MSLPEETSERIIDAALELFSELGYKGATTRKIAEMAGVNEVTVFRHFESKEKLLYAVIDREANIRDRILKAKLEPTGDLVKDLSRIGLYIAENMFSRAKLMRLVVLESDQHPEIWEHISQAPFEALKQLSGYFNKARKDGLIKDVDPELVAVAFFSFFIRSLLARAFLGDDVFLKMDKSTIRNYTKLFVYGISK